MLIFSSLVKEKKTMLVLGDSQAIATFGEIKREFKGEYNVDLSAKVGTRIGFWSKDKLKALETPRDVVVIFLGSNGYDAHPENVKPIIDSLGTAQCVWVGPPKVRGHKYRFNEELKAAVVDRCKYIDSQKLNLVLPDGVHPDSSSARLWSYVVGKAVRNKHE